MTCVTVCCFSYNRRCRYIYRTMYYIDRERNIDPSQRHRALTAHHLHTYIINAPTPPPQAPRTTKTNVSIWKIFFSLDKRTNDPRHFHFSTSTKLEIRESSSRVPSTYRRTICFSFSLRSRFVSQFPSLGTSFNVPRSQNDDSGKKKKLYTTVAYSTYSTCNTRFYSTEKSLPGVGK